MAVKEKTSSVNFRVRLFGAVREAAGNRVVELPLDASHATVGNLKRSLFVAYPKIDSGAFLIVAVNRVIANDSTEVTPKDEIAVMPLVSGG